MANNTPNLITNKTLIYVQIDFTMTMPTTHMYRQGQGDNWKSNIKVKHISTKFTKTLTDKWLVSTTFLFICQGIPPNLNHTLSLPITVHLHANHEKSKLCALIASGICTSYMFGKLRDNFCLILWIYLVGSKVIKRNVLGLHWNRLDWIHNSMLMQLGPPESTHIRAAEN